MKKFIALIMVALVLVFASGTGTAFAAKPFAEQVQVDNANFDKELSGASGTVQDVLDFIDEKEFVTMDEIDTIAKIEAITGEDIITSSENNDTADDLSDNVIGDLSNVDETGKAEGKVLKYDASGNLIVADDETGTIVMAQEKFIGDGATTSFTFANNFASGSLLVFLNSLKQEITVDYTEKVGLDGVDFGTAPKTGWVVEVYYVQD